MKPDGQWKALEEPNPVIESGSALDLGSFFPGEPVGKYGRVIAAPSGNFSLEKKPETNLIFFGCSIGMDTIFSKLTTKALIDAYVGQVVRQGYNLVRPHFLDHFLMQGANADLDFNAERLDLFEYFVSRLKEHGIYLYFDAMTSWSGYKKGSGWSAIGKSEYDLKRKIMLRSESREHWRLGVQKLLSHENPYTKTKLADDPVIAVLLFFNELEFYSSGGVLPEMTEIWRTWLKEKYGDRPALEKSWGSAKLKSVSDFKDVPLFTANDQWALGNYGGDVGTFMLSRELEMGEWFLREIRSMGYPGLTSLWDCWKNNRSVMARVPLGVVSMHNYHGHPTKFVDPGSQIDQQSSVATLAGYWRAMAAMRLADRPFIVTEYSQVFWNQFRYEEGLVMGAYSALQGFQGLMAHANPVVFDLSKPITPFSHGLDPVARANQVLVFFLFRRQDVKTSTQFCELHLDETYLLANGNLNRAPTGSEAALLTRFGISYGKAGQPNLPEGAARLRLSPTGGAEVKATAGTMEVVGSDGSLAESVAALLKKNNLLPDGNATAPERGFFQSDTGEIRLEKEKKYLSVTSAFFEGAALADEAPRTLSALSRVQTSVPACVAATSLDGKPISESSRLLIFYITDARNTAMELSADGSTLRALGTSPYLIKTGKFSFSIRSKTPGTYQIWPLGLDGKRKEAVNISRVKEELRISVDTANLKNGPTFFFEIAAK